MSTSITNKQITFRYYDDDFHSYRSKEGFALDGIPRKMGFDLIVLTEDGDVRGVGLEDVLSVEGKVIKELHQDTNEPVVPRASEADIFEIQMPKTPYAILEELARRSKTMSTSALVCRWLDDQIRHERNKMKKPEPPPICLRNDPTKCGRVNECVHGGKCRLTSCATDPFRPELDVRNGDQIDNVLVFCMSYEKRGD